MSAALCEQNGFDPREINGQNNQDSPGRLSEEVFQPYKGHRRDIPPLVKQSTTCGSGTSVAAIDGHGTPRRQFIHTEVTSAETTSNTESATCWQSGHATGGKGGRSVTRRDLEQDRQIHCPIQIEIDPDAAGSIGDHSMRRSSNGTKSGVPPSLLQHSGHTGGGATTGIDAKGSGMGSCTMTST